jgi:GT2 family glycosyltransferase
MGGSTNQKNFGKVKLPSVAVIILNWNGWKDTIECLDSILRIEYPSYQIIVVDNGSSDDSIEELKDWISGLKGFILKSYKEIIALAENYASFEQKLACDVITEDNISIPLILLETNSNRGYSGGNNVGLAWAMATKYEYALILNNDVRVEANIIANLINAAVESNADVVGALIKDSDGKEVLFAKSFYPYMLLYSESNDRVPSDKWWITDQVNGSAMLVSRGLLLNRWQSLGYFLDESLFLYCEEIELAMWCRAAGKMSIIAGNAIVYHKVSKSFGGKGKPLQFYYLTRNRILIARRYLGPSSTLLFSIIYIPFRVIRAGMYLMNRRPSITKAILQGLLDGYEGKSGQKP